MDTLERTGDRLERARPTIMVVDDELAVRESFAAILEDDYDLAMAESGEEALAELRTRNDINMVFLDYKLPGIDGLEFLKALQQHRISVPVVMVTGRGTREIAAKAFQYEVEDYITKPFRVEDIQEVVVKVLRKMQNQRTPLMSAKELIDTCVDRNLSTKEVANSVGIRYRRLVRQFKAETGTTIVGFKNVKRIEYAKKYLREKDWSIKDVATALGFRGQNYFSYVFRKIVGMTPTAYRNLYR